MKDLVSCFSEHAVRISDVACSGAANAAAGAPGLAGGGGGRPAAAQGTRGRCSGHESAAARTGRVRDARRRRETCQDLCTAEP